MSSLFLEAQVNARIPPHTIGHPWHCIPSASGSDHMTQILCLLSNDIAVNPDPKQHDVNTAPRPVSVFPCGHCELTVTWLDHAVCCDSCSIWFHRSCHDMFVTWCINLDDESLMCHCCHTPLWDTFHSYEISDIVRQHSVHSVHDAHSRITDYSHLPDPSDHHSTVHR